MARARTILQSEYPYNISSRCINREWFKIPMEQVWDIFSEELFATSKIHNLQIYSFVLMSNHSHLNPVEAGICSRVEDYPYSTLFGLLGKAKLFIPVIEDDTLFGNVEKSLDWLNRKPDEPKLEAVRFALKRPYFKSKKCPKTNAPILGDDDVI